MNKDASNNNVGNLAGTTGGHQVIYNKNTNETDIKVPQQSQEDRPAGFAKASPNFKPLPPKATASEEDEEEIIKENLLTKDEDVKETLPS